ncbi:MAG TPA: hypothetical protein VIM84_07680, partial [Gemmatimonadales bacterium]
PQGNSLLYGLPFVAETYNKMLAALKETWLRYGTPKFHVTYVPPDTLNDPRGLITGPIANQIARALEQTLRDSSNGKTSDLVTVGDVRISIIGAEGEALDIEVPGRQILEQIVAKTGLPSWMLGLHWSTTERMSSVEASLLGEMIDHIREHLEAEIRYLFTLRQLLVGRPFEWELEWEAPSIIDQMQTAQAEKTEAEALSARIKANRELWSLGALTDIMFVQRVLPEFEGKSEAEIRRMLPGLLAQPPSPVMAVGAGQVNGQQENDNAARPFGRSLTYSNGRH